MTRRAIDDPVRLARAARIVRGALTRRDLDVKARVAQSRREQGLPPTVMDPSVLRQVAALFDTGGPPPLSDMIERRKAEQAAAEVDIAKSMSQQEWREVAAKPNPKQAATSRVRSKAEKLSHHRAMIAELLNEDTTD